MTACFEPRPQAESLMWEVERLSDPDIGQELCGFGEYQWGAHWRRDKGVRYRPRKLSGLVKEVHVATIV